MGKRKYQVKQYEIKKANAGRTKDQINAWIRENRNKLLFIPILIFVLVLVVALLRNVNRPEEQDIISKDLSNSQIEHQNLEITESADEIVGNTDITFTPEYIQKYIEINSGTVGYIEIDNTKIDYPVVQTDNNEYYLDHNYRFEKDDAGAVFMDFRCDIDDFSKTRNIILYGHRMKDGSMFKDLIKYQDQSFFFENRIIQFDTLNGEYRWKVFSVFETTTDFYYIDTEFPLDEMWLDFLDQANMRSMHTTRTNLYPDDIVLILSTCTAEDDGRFVVMAKLMQ